MEKYYDAKGQEIVFDEKDFKLCQSEKRITDRNFDTKAVTFIKDAFKRFCKNKSSIVAAFIIALLLLLAVLYPAISTTNISVERSYEGYLPPKLFSSTSSMWNGTRYYDKQIYDPSTNNPTNTQSFKPHGIVEYTNITKEGENFINYYVYGAYGGYLVIGCENSNAMFYTYHKINYTVAGGYKVVFTIEDVVDTAPFGTYRVYLEHDGETIYLTDFQTKTGAVEVNISQKISDAGLTEVKNGRLGIEVLYQNEIKSSVPIKEISLTADNVTDQAILDTLAALSMDDANFKMSLNKLQDGTFPLGFWQTAGSKKLFKANIIYCSFIYDPYAATYGVQRKTDFGGSEMQKYIENGWCEYDFTVGPSSFKKLSDKCPIEQVYKQSRIVLPDVILYTMEVEITMYKYLGYNKMPVFLLGTDGSGYDIVKQTFFGLRLSLFLALTVSAICLSFGLVWGAISGYFGGNVDILMERFMEILGGVPWTVLMTLIMLLLGQTLITLGIALCATGWMGIAGRTRTQFYRFKGREYVLASRTLGSSDMRLIFRHILPNAMGTIVTGAVLMIPSVVFRESSLAYLGLVKLSSLSLGNLLASNQSFINSYPALIVFPAIILSLLMISFNLFGNGLRDALNPSLKGSE